MIYLKKIIELITNLLKKVTLLLNLLYILIITNNKFKNLIIIRLKMWKTDNSLRLLLPHFFNYISVVINAYRGSSFKIGVGLLCNVMPVPSEEKFISTSG